MPLERAVHEALDRVKRRPGLLVVGATDRSESAVAARGPLPGPDCPPERAVLEIGSITKVFTALLLAIAVKRGEASLDDPVLEHLPTGTRVPRRDSVDITLMHLATHTSGLPRLPPGSLWEGLRNRHDPYARLTRERVLDAVGRTRQRRAAGARMAYSNFGAGLLGLALAHTAGSDYETLVCERITDPLGMADTLIILSANQRARIAPGTTRRDKPAGLWSISGLVGAGALRSTVADLLKFARAQMGLLPPDAPVDLAAAIAATHEPRARAAASPLRCGWGSAGSSCPPAVQSWRPCGTTAVPAGTGASSASRRRSARPR